MMTENPRGPVFALAAMLEKSGIVIAGALLIVMTLYTLLESFMRSAFGLSTYVMAELVGYSMAPLTTLAMARTLRRGMLIRLSLVVNLLPLKLQRVAELISILLTLLLTLYLIWLFWAEVSFNWHRDAVSNTIARVPLWIPPALVLSGLPVFALHLALYGYDILLGKPRIAEVSEVARA